MLYVTIPRIILGLIFVVLDLIALLGVVSMPPPPEAGKVFMGGLMSSGYFYPLLKSTEIISGLMLLTNIAVPLALVFLAPIIVNIFLYHAFLDPSGLPLAIVLVALEIFLAVAYRHNYSLIFKIKNQPTPFQFKRREKGGGQLRTVT